MSPSSALGDQARQLAAIQRLIEAQGYRIEIRVGPAAGRFIAQAEISRHGHLAAHLLGSFELTEEAAELALLSRFEVFVSHFMEDGP